MPFCVNRLGPVLLCSNPLSHGSGSWDWPNILAGPCYGLVSAQSECSKGVDNKAQKVASWIVVRWASYSRRK